MLKLKIIPSSIKSNCVSTFSDKQGNHIEICIILLIDFNIINGMQSNKELRVREREEKRPSTGKTEKRYKTYRKTVDHGTITNQIGKVNTRTMENEMIKEM